METKYCSKCHRELPVECFSKDKRMKDGYQFYCKSCQNKYRRESLKRREFAKIADDLSKGFINPKFEGITSNEIIRELRDRGYKGLESIYIEETKVEKHYVKL